ncbi:glutathione synthase [Ferribacterium limneticum]|uniref:glutathione synthase n=1 Tax=Ferribacterium limneticum TaxID=76259 RepID=UPI001CFBA138|nr:glutathione synthase [Ferribacterium limneticum]UCV28551.1 glutathione synthase [Ferribacterium limneticum]UCV32468.1 glutathione synthase [Ferribacterium limneticum]
MAQQLHFEKHLLGGSSQSLKLAFVLDPLDHLKAWKDSSVAMMRAAENHGHEVFAIDAATLGWRKPDAAHVGGVSGEALHLHLRPDDHDWYRETGREWMPLKAFDAVIMRKDPPFDFEYLTATWLLERAEEDGVKVFNRPRALRNHSEKLAIMEFAHFSPATMATRSMAQIHHFIDEQRDVILKPLDGMGGSQIFRVHRNDPNRNVIVETLTNDGARTIMAQRYVPEIAAGDKRILLIAGKPVPWCLARIPKAGETRGNLAVGGTGVAQELSARDREIAEAIGPVLFKRGLMLIGIDVIGDYLTEINVTSPTCMVEIRQQSGFDAAGAFITAVEHACGLA